MVLGVSLATSAGVAAGMLHLFNHALMKGALFMALGTLFWRTGSVRLDRLAGIGREMPWTMTAFALAGLSLIGVPLTAGFVSKWYLVMAVLEAGQPWLIALIMITSLMAVYYVWRVIEAAWFTPAPSDRTAVREAPARLLVPVYIVLAANFWFGIDTRLSVGGAEAAARALLGGGP
jgi:multicomponent Na+:H+ antiporter subunit D